jgi:uncharacterized protein YpmS
MKRFAILAIILFALLLVISILHKEPEEELDVVAEQNKELVFLREKAKQTTLSSEEINKLQKEEIEELKRTKQ